MKLKWKLFCIIVFLANIAAVYELIMADLITTASAIFTVPLFAIFWGWLFKEEL